jgi:F0F1-type ATP synthase membrane subunit c/vacuolar-type H+-ATPase subunit K
MVEPTQLMVAKDIVCMLAVFSASIGSGRAVAKALGVDKWNIKKALE